jgi:hypothetical protein
MGLASRRVGSEPMLAEMPDLKMENLKAALRSAALRLDHPVLAT